MRLGVAVINYDRRTCLDAFIGWAWTNRWILDGELVVVHTGKAHKPGPIERAAEADGFTIDHHHAPNNLPMARAAAECLLVEKGHTHFLISDDDVLLDLSRHSVESLSDRDIIGGGLRQGWPEPMTDKAYMAWLRSDNPVPGGRVVPVTAIYQKPMLGLWQLVSQLGIDFVGEDQAWCYLAYLRGAQFRNRGFVGLHAPPKRPGRYPTFPYVWDQFRKNLQQHLQHTGGSL